MRTRDSYRRLRQVYEDTSRLAWESVQQYLPAVDAAILRVLLEQDGATCDEIERVTGLKHQTVSAQLAHLREANLVAKSGHLRRTGSGRSAHVYIVAPVVAPAGRLF